MANQYQPSRYSTPYQPFDTKNNHYYTPGPMTAPSQILPITDPRSMLPPPTRARFAVLKSIEESPNLESPSPTPEQRHCDQSHNLSHRNLGHMEDI